MMISVFTIIYFIASTTEATVYKDCGSSAAKITSFEIPTCPDGTGPCSFKRGTNVTLNVQLTPNEDIESVTTSVSGIIAGIKTPFISREDACKSSVKCPLKANVPVTYSEAIFVMQAYPKLRLVADLEVKTNDGKLMICAQFPVEITD